MNHRLFLSILLLPLHPSLVQSQESIPGLKVPPGFVVTQYADHTLANDIYCMTIDPKGRIVVSGRGYIKVLVDDDNDGKADRAIDFADSPKDGAMGLYWEKDTLYVTGDGGLRRFYDKDGDGKADGPSELIRKIKTGGEHTAHAVKRGPDGWLYVLCGDGAGIDKSYATLPTSPIKDPIGGCVIRFTPDLKDSEIVAHGFRNAYGMDFNHNGDFYTFDSDNERCLNLPWYEPTRFYQVIDGGFYGWLAPQRATFWRMPPYFFDVIPPVAYMGRGSPTGVVWYGHKQFPEEYQGGFFALDWTFGKVYFLWPQRLEWKTTKLDGEVFLEATGDNGFAPTASAVHPDAGDLFISVGGRGTRGAVYRIRHRARHKQLTSLNSRYEPLQDDRGRLREKEMDNRSWFAEAYAIAKRFPKEQRKESLAQAVRSQWSTHNQVVRLQVIDTLKILWPQLTKDEKQVWINNARKPSNRLVLAAAMVSFEPEESIPLIKDLLNNDLHPDIVLGAIRVLQIAMGDIGSPKARGTYREGYSLRTDKLPVVIANAVLDDVLLKLVSSSSTEVYQEVTRTLSMLEPKRLGTCKQDAASALEKIHLAMCLAASEFHEDLEHAAWIVLGAEQELSKRGKSLESNGPLRLKEVLAVIKEKHPDICHLILKNRDYDFGRPEHLVFTQIRDFPRLSAATTFAKRIEEEPDYPLSAGIINLLSELPPKYIVPRARKWWSNPSLRPALLPILARMPEAEDYPRFIEGLHVSSPNVIRASLAGLNSLPGQKERQADEVHGLLRAIIGLNAKEEKLSGPLFFRLESVTNKGYGHDLGMWRAWFRKTHPKLAARLENPDGVDVSTWEKRLGKIDWDRGDAGRGQKVFAKASCVQCHGGSASVGPDLAGVTGRFSRADLFTAILQPSKDVADRYRTTLVETKEGKTYQGLVIYDAIDSLILHTREGTTARILGPDIADRRQIDVSPMPSGLLETLTDAEIADLYVYLRGRK